jgi:hypothetical protein
MTRRKPKYTYDDFDSRGEMKPVAMVENKTCLLCPNKAAPGSYVCTACFYQQYPPIKARICTTRSAKRGAKLRAERGEAGRCE